MPRADSPEYDTTYLQYLHWAGLGLAGALLLIIAAFTLGLSYGMCGKVE